MAQILHLKPLGSAEPRELWRTFELIGAGVMPAAIQGVLDALRTPSSDPHCSGDFMDGSTPFLTFWDGNGRPDLCWILQPAPDGERWMILSADTNGPVIPSAETWRAALGRFEDYLRSRGRRTH